MNEDIKINDHFKNIYYRLNMILVIMLFAIILYAYAFRSINERNLIFQSKLIYLKPHIDSLISQNDYYKYQQFIDSLMKSERLK